MAMLIARVSRDVCLRRMRVPSASLASWEAVRGTLQKNFTQRVKAFDASLVSAEACALVRAALPSGDDALASVGKASVACAPLYQWAQASLDLVESLLAAAPAREAMERLEAEVSNSIPLTRHTSTIAFTSTLLSLAHHLRDPRLWFARAQIAELRERRAHASAEIDAMDGRMRRLVAEVETLRIEVEEATRVHAAAAQMVAACNQAEAGGDANDTGTGETTPITILQAASYHPDTQGKVR